MATPQNNNLLTNAKLRSSSPENQFASLAFAYLDSARQLCDSLARAPADATFERSTVVLYLSAHAVELFLKGAIIRKSPLEHFGHNLEQIYNRYRALFPAARFQLSNMPFGSEYVGLTSQEIAEVKREQPDASEQYRYPVNRAGAPWDAAIGFDTFSYCVTLFNMRTDFEKIIAELDLELR